MNRFFRTNYKSVLIAIIILCCILFFIALIQIAQGNIAGLEPLLYGFGFLLLSAFNWADVSVFSLLWVILAVILLRMKQKEFFWIAYFAFWFIRSFDEVMYSFLQQFHPETKPWALYMPRAIMQQTSLGHFILGRYWVIEQIFFQSITVLSLFGLLYMIVKISRNKEKR